MRPPYSLWWFIWLLALALLAAGEPARGQAQEERVSLQRAVSEGLIQVNRLTGRSPLYFQPMMVLEARNTTGAPLQIDVTRGTILQAQNPSFCDVIVLDAETPLYFDGVSKDAFPFYLYGYCQQLAPSERAFPSEGRRLCRYRPASGPGRSDGAITDNGQRLRE